MTRWTSVLRVIVGTVVVGVLAHAQAPQAPETPAPRLRPAWRMAGNTPCVGPWGGIYECPPAPTVVAVPAGGRGRMRGLPSTTRTRKHR